MHCEEHAGEVDAVGGGLVAGEDEDEGVAEDLFFVESWLGLRWVAGHLLCWRRRRCVGFGFGGESGASDQRAHEVHSVAFLAALDFVTFLDVHLAHVLTPLNVRLVGLVEGLVGDPLHHPFREDQDHEKVVEQCSQSVFESQLVTRWSFLDEPILVRPSETNIESSSGNDMQTQTHSLIGNVVQRLAHFVVRAHPTSHHGSRLLERFLPDDAVVALCERRAADFAMVPPDCTLGGDDILAKDIKRSVEIYGLGEVDASSGDLSDGFCVCD